MTEAKDDTMEEPDRTQDTVSLPNDRVEDLEPEQEDVTDVRGGSYDIKKVETGG